MSEDEKREREAQRILASAIYLMTCHARIGCPRLAEMIREHFRQLARNSSAGDLVRAMCQRLGPAWDCVRAHDERRAHAPQPAAPSTLH